MGASSSAGGFGIADDGRKNARKAQKEKAGGPAGAQQISLPPPANAAGNARVPKPAPVSLLARPDHFQRALRAWYRRHARPLPWREAPTLYKTVVSEFMLQQTQVKAVLPYFARWLAALPDFAALAAAPAEQVLKLWEGLGYYSRARNLHRLAKALVAGPPVAPDSGGVAGAPGHRTVHRRRHHQHRLWRAGGLRGRQRRPDSGPADRRPGALPGRRSSGQGLHPPRRLPGAGGRPRRPQPGDDGAGSDRLPAPAASVRRLPGAKVLRGGPDLPIQPPTRDSSPSGANSALSSGFGANATAPCSFIAARPTPGGSPICTNCQPPSRRVWRQPPPRRGPCLQRGPARSRAFRFPNRSMPSPGPCETERPDWCGCPWPGWTPWPCPDRIDAGCGKSSPAAPSPTRQEPPGPAAAQPAGSRSSIRAFEARTSSAVARGLSSMTSVCSGRQKPLTILKSILPDPTAW